MGYRTITASHDLQNTDNRRLRLTRLVNIIIYSNVTFFKTFKCVT